MNLKRQLIFSFFVVVILAGCSLDPNEQYIQGVWEISQPDETITLYRWHFSNGGFTREQMIAGRSPLFTEGSYRVVESAGDVLILELDNFRGSRISYENNPITVKIEIDHDQGTINITNTEFVPATK